MPHVAGWQNLPGVKTDLATRQRPAGVPLTKWWGASDYNLVKTNLEALDAAVVALGTGGVGNTGIGVGSGETTDGSTVTLLTLAIGTDEAWTVTLLGHSFRPDTSPKVSSHFGPYIVGIKNSGGTVVVVGSAAMNANFGAFSASLSFVVDGTNVLVQITGNAGQHRKHWVTGFGVKGG